MSDEQPVRDGESGDFARTVELVRAARTGDDAALAAVFERYAPRIREMVALRLGRRLAELVEIDDLVQESMVRALKSIDDFRELNEGTFRAYVARIVHNCVSDEARRLTCEQRGGGQVRRESDLATALLAQCAEGREPSPTRRVVDAEEHERVEAAMLALQPRHREVLGLRHVLELSFAEIREAMGLGAEASARSLYMRARLELGRRLPDLDPDAAIE